MKFAIYNHKLVSANETKPHLRYKCPLCGKRLICHQASGQRKAYFSHVLSVTSFDNPGETSEHVKGKYQLAKFFKSTHNTVIVEKYLSRINQWPDLMVDDKIVEFQCSPISTKKLTSRITGYSKMHLKSWWILGSPYQRRRLRPSYIARFLNYSNNLGFFILFWQVKRKCLMIHYGISESGGRRSYRVKWLYTCQGLKTFITHNQLRLRFVNKFILRRAVTSEMNVNRKRLFYGDRMLIDIQQKVSQEHNTVLGCPIICHVPVYSFPIFRERTLLWRLMIILMIHRSSDLWDVYNQANFYLGLPLTFCQISNYKILYRRAFVDYVSLLAKFRYVKIDFKRKKITELKKFRWFNSYYDKLNFLRRYY